LNEQPDRYGIKIRNCYLILYFYFLAVTIKLMKKG